MVVLSTGSAVQGCCCDAHCRSGVDALRLSNTKRDAVMQRRRQRQQQQQRCTTPRRQKKEVEGVLTSSHVARRLVGWRLDEK
ncbi:uncharacterized protein M421DRAFT_426899 [Didymella exigua CBS 183.55]|uniref:Uncharacterized protein n=1 Tax=Didymella exigua CBS 183.55 TaxID=1150837 RepID=A0A6A5R4X0_9PLEO|nr:uncharacterized protein M421DRAFT_426899 [Didymella exigua CBS 183.55]KAF1922449.1 hypothetical protein M421DRAFT_426899 [Didymella exigua CBS 183.55]